MKATSNEKVKALTDLLEQGVKDVFTSKNYLNYLNTMSKFHQYSASNVMAIHMQKPDATRVAGFNSWKKNFNRSIKKGEKGIAILAPAPFKKKVDKLVYAADGKPVMDGKGNQKTEEVEVTIPHFKTVHVFDVSQTVGEPLPTLTTELKDTVEDYEKLIEALKKISPYPIQFEEIEGGAKGYCSHREEKIVIKKDMSQSQSIKTAIHEIAHAKLHVPMSIDKGRSSKEVEAESVAFVTANHFGVDTSDYSFTYVASWSRDKELSELKASLETIQKQSLELISDIENQLEELSLQADQEVGIDYPYVRIEFSEHSGFQDEEILSFADAENKIIQLEKDVIARQKEAAVKGEYYGYFKTKFEIVTDIPDVESYKGRYDIGDGEMGLVNHIQNYTNELKEQYPELVMRAFITGEPQNYQEKIEFLENKFLPYLKDNLAPLNNKESIIGKLGKAKEKSVEQNSQREIKKVGREKDIAL